MNREDLVHLKTWFSNYVASYYTNDKDYNYAIRLKEEHTKRVCRNTITLGKKLDLSEQDIIVAETMALFHDIGRFKQYATYGTFNDMASENHAELGLKQLAMHHTLSVCTKEERRCIIKAIAYHNAAVLPENQDAKTLFFMRLLRDADKIDIWNVVIDYYQNRDKLSNTVVEIGLPDDPVFSKKVIKALDENKIVRMQHVSTLNDFKLLQISWVFDLNFAPSFQTVKSLQYIEQIAATLPRSKEIQAVVKKARDYVNTSVRSSPN